MTDLDGVYNRPTLCFPGCPGTGSLDWMKRYYPTVASIQCGCEGGKGIDTVDTFGDRDKIWNPWNKGPYKKALFVENSGSCPPIVAGNMGLNQWPPVSAPHGPTTSLEKCPQMFAANPYHPVQALLYAPQK